MFLPSWLSGLSTHHRNPRRQRRTFVPRLDILEERTLLASHTSASLPPILAAGAHAGSDPAIPAGTHRTRRPEGKIRQANAGTRPSLISVTPLDSTTLLLRFSGKLGRGAANPNSYDIPGLTVLAVQVLRNRRSVLLTTTPQEGQAYTVSLRGLRAQGGGTVTTQPATATVVGVPNTPPPDTTPPRVTGAISAGNTRVLVSFSEAMTDAALNPAFYRINQVAFNPEAGTLRVLGARTGEESSTPKFVSGDRKLVELTTTPQNEMAYTLTAFNLTDLAGNPFAPPTISGSQRLDPAQAIFTGTPPSGTELVDSDGDGLTDNDEMRGWLVTVTPANYIKQERWVTSDPFSTDTDGDGFTDDVEAQLRLDPRDQDSDDDLLTDWQEYTEVFSDHLHGDSDRDGVDDGTEFLGVKSSPVFADTDGDQIPDGIEIPLGGPRNILVSDLPRPEITVGGVNLALDVRFTETNNRERRDLGTESFRTNLASAVAITSTISSTTSIEFHVAGKFGQEDAEVVAVGETGLNVGHAFSSSQETALEARREYERSLQTEQEVTRGFTTERNVVGATMQVAVNLHNLSNLAYRVKNLQITALTLDPQDHTRLTPVATLVPDVEPEEGFTLGPLVADRGPIIFSNDNIIPRLVEDLMANSTGLIFRISNYDIIDEDGRNFAFTSQEVVERTGAVLIDYGGASQLLAQVSGEDFDQINPPPQVETYRVATATGRAIADTNGDGRIDPGPARELFDAQGNSLGIDADGDGQITDADAEYVPDRRVTFDPKGNLVGISFHQALSSIGLARYDETTTPTANLSQEQIRNSYSTIRVGNQERIHRIRDIANDTLNERYWEIIGPRGIVQDADLDRMILTSSSPISLNFVQDLDKDGLPTDVEYFLRTSDNPTPRFIDFANGRVPSSTDVSGDEIAFGNVIGPVLFPTGTLVRVSETGGGLTAGTNYFMRHTGGGISYQFYTSQAAALAGGTAGLVDLTAPITATVATGPAAGRDTDGDGLDDPFEALLGWQVTTPQRVYRVYSSPNRADSNFDSPLPGVDSDGDGVEDRLEYNGSDFAAAPADWTDRDNNGLRDPGEVFQLATGDLVLDPIRRDSDGDGIDDATEVIGYPITRLIGGTILVRSNPNTPFTDSDTFSDGLERLLGLDPTDGNDTDEDGDGLPDSVERTGWTVRTFGVSTTPHQQGPLTPRTVTSRTNSVDSDDDGLTDYDEYFLNTDPSSRDSDSDGLEDRLEALGYTLGHEVGGRNLGIIKTDPLDADHDNDLRSDGAEAERIDIEANRWVVRPVGEVPYRVFSDPLQADADFDFLVDGEEFSANGGLYRSDPNTADTDDDGRLDGAEFSLNLNPLVEDFLVTVIYRDLAVSIDGESTPTDTGDFGFTFGVRQPGTTPTGLSATVDTVVDTQEVLSSVGLPGTLINIDDNQTLTLSHFLTEAQRSFSFSMTRNQRFTIEGQVLEHDLTTFQFINFGGLDGTRGTLGDGSTAPGVFEGAQLTRGTIQDISFTLTPFANLFGFTGGFPFVATVRAMFVVN